METKIPPTSMEKDSAIFHKVKEKEKQEFLDQARTVHFDSRATIKHGFLYPRQRYLKNIIESIGSTWLRAAWQTR